jgi:hypothetical protein
VHIAAAQKLLNAAATPFIHVPQAAPRRVIDFYSQRVLPGCTPEPVETVTRRAC